ncbi:hypothetical protein ACSTKY_22930, partial [Vibrio parahaemolyticus]
NWRRRKLNRITSYDNKLLLDNKWTTVFDIAGIICAVSFILIIVSKNVAIIFGALSCVMLAFSVWIWLISLFKRRAIKHNVKVGFAVLL